MIYVLESNYENLGIAELKKIITLAGGRITLSPKEANLIVDNQAEPMMKKDEKPSNVHVVSHKWVIN